MSYSLFQQQGAHLPDRIYPLAYPLTQGIDLPGPNQIHVFLCQDSEVTDVAILTACNAILSDEEQQRMARFRFMRDRRQYLLTRALSRYVLSAYLPDIAPVQWIFGKGRHGKPLVSGPRQHPVRFNLSHTTGLIAMASSVYGEIGIDVETYGTQADCIAMMDMALTTQEKEQFRKLASHPQQQIDYFFALWTLKEAYLKALGTGMDIALDQIFFYTDQKGHIRVDNHRHGAPTECWFDSFNVFTAKKIALAMPVEKGADSIEVLVHHVRFDDIAEGKRNLSCAADLI